MLTCFSLQNVLNGLLIFLKDVFKRQYTIATYILDKDSGEVMKKIENMFELEQILKSEYSDCPVIYEIDVEGRGSILMDMFTRSSKYNQHQTSTLTEVGCSTLENQRAVAYIVDGMDKSAQYLSFEQVVTIFHEFGHALNIALSNTKYQYHSCARASVDISEIPSHFAELFLKDYDFVKKFAVYTD